MLTWDLSNGRFVCRGFKDFQAFTGTRRFAVEPGCFAAADLRSAAARFGLNPDAVVGMEQVHGGIVRAVDRAEDAVVPGCDGLVTDCPSTVLVMRSADCLPVVAYDPVRRVIGVAHAGWKGLKSGIAKCLVDTLIAHFGSVPEAVYVGIGPGIGSCCYEVGAEFERWFPRHLKPENGKCFFDLKAAAADQLVSAGIQKARVFSSPWCTSCFSEECFSYRRDGPGGGRLITCVMLSS